MNGDPHWIWRRAAQLHEAMEREAPEGYVPVVEAAVAGRAQPVAVDVVKTYSEQGWSLLHVLGDPEHGAAPDDAFVYVRVANVLSIEVRYRRAGATPIGFQHREVADDEG